jgi:hypothetical protein
MMRERLEEPPEGAAPNDGYLELVETLLLT